LAQVAIVLAVSILFDHTALSRLFLVLLCLCFGLGITHSPVKIKFLVTKLYTKMGNLSRIVFSNFTFLFNFLLLTGALSYCMILFISAQVIKNNILFAKKLQEPKKTIFRHERFLYVY